MNYTFKEILARGHGVNLFTLVNHIFKKYHFGAFSVFYTNYSLILGDKKIQTQKWCIREKFRHQKLGVTKGFFKLNFLYFWFRPLFGKMIAASPGNRTVSKSLACGQLKKVRKYQKDVLLVLWFIFGVSYMFESTVMDVNSSKSHCLTIKFHNCHHSTPQS